MAGAFLVATGGVSRKYPGFRGRFPGCSALPVGSGGAVAGFEPTLRRPPDEFGITAPTSAGQLTLRRQQVAQSK